MERRRAITQYDVFWITLDPTEGSEIAKTRPCVVISPDELNKYLRTVIVAPVTSTLKAYPFRINCMISGKEGSIALDQIRTVDKLRIGGYLGQLSVPESNAVKDILREMLC
ncbi:MAG: type II toxin-antitoxin system PemK/MazF family toxin [Bacteroidia bacterium]|nr:type II toxin-antitoxin system PemK/MazF family toxin [Bacteroidia bacterium]